MLSYRSMYESPLLKVRDFQCRACRSGPANEEHSGSNNIVLLRHGAFCKHFGRHAVTSDVNQATFFSKGSTYRVSHPGECGDRGTVFIISRYALNDIIRELDPNIDDHPEKPFPFITGPCDDRAFWRHREFILRLESADAYPPEPLWTEVTGLQLMADILEAAFLRHGSPRQRRRQSTEADHRDRVEAAKCYLASRLGERITLSDVARALHTSPFHLSRMFQQGAGIPLHRYLNQVRLRASLERLAEGADDLTALALQLGFSSHSHFTDAFRREFGQAPSQIRSKTLRQLSKNLEV